MVYYVEPVQNDSVGIFEYFRYVNTTADGLFFPIILGVLWVIIFTAVKNYKTSIAWTTASAICAFLSIPLVALEVVANWWMYLFIFFTAAGTVWLKLEKSSV